MNPKVKKALEDKKNVTYIEKPTFLSTALVQYISGQQPDDITLIGLCTDICVVSNALALRGYFYNTPIHVIEHCCAGVTKDKHLAALEVMRSCQIDVK